MVIDNVCRSVGLIGVNFGVGVGRGGKKIERPKFQIQTRYLVYIV